MTIAPLSPNISYRQDQSARVHFRPESVEIALRYKMRSDTFSKDLNITTHHNSL